MPPKDATSVSFGFAPYVPPLLPLTPCTYSGPERTVIVVGVMRGGTSALSAILCAAGVNMGLDWANHEDLGMVRAVCDREGNVRDVIAQRNRNDVWGFKATRFMDTRQPDELHSDFRNPCYAIAFRDPVAITQTHLAMSGGAGAEGVFLQMVQQQQQMVDWVMKLPMAPKALVSYQRILQQPAQLCSDLLDWLRLSPATSQQRASAVAAISRQGGYLAQPQSQMRHTHDNT